MPPNQRMPAPAGMLRDMVVDKRGARPASSRHRAQGDGVRLGDRSGQRIRPRSTELVAAWVSVPELTVRPSRQRYDHVAPGTVRYTDLGVFAGFTEEVTFDEDGLVTRYPGLAVAARPVEPA